MIDDDFATLGKLKGTYIYIYIIQMTPPQILAIHSSGNVRYIRRILTTSQCFYPPGLNIKD